MHSVLNLCDALPEVHVAAGTVLIEEGVPTDRIYVLRTGVVDVIRNGVRVVAITEPGAFVGEISALLGSAPTADVVVMQDSTFHVIENAGVTARGNPDLTYAIAQLLARRLQAVTSYLVDIKQQYAGTDKHLSLMDQVLANLMTMQGAAGMRSGSERSE